MRAINYINKTAVLPAKEDRRRSQSKICVGWTVTRYLSDIYSHILHSPFASHTLAGRRVSAGLRRDASIPYVISRRLRDASQGSRNVSFCLHDAPPRRGGSYPVAADGMQISRNMSPGSLGASKSFFGMPNHFLCIMKSSPITMKGSFITRQAVLGESNMLVPALFISEHIFFIYK
ncbi:MAG: hypothetical protein LBD80_05510 [Tannerella sp.]|jgi:hypothetical protein|nr:hypothetical protein [Tannerella sp.]